MYVCMYVCMYGGGKEGRREEGGIEGGKGHCHIYRIYRLVNGSKVLPLFQPTALNKLVISKLWMLPGESHIPLPPKIKTAMNRV